MLNSCSIKIVLLIHVFLSIDVYTVYVLYYFVMFYVFYLFFMLFTFIM